MRRFLQQLLSDWARLFVSLTHVHAVRAQVDAYGVHMLVCERALRKISRYHAINDVIARAFDAADMPVTKTIQYSTTKDRTV